MNKPTIRIHDTSTNEIIDREMNDDEFAHYEIMKAAAEAKKAAAEQQAQAKADLLEKLGITQAEADLLLS